MATAGEGKKGRINWHTMGRKQDIKKKTGLRQMGRDCDSWCEVA
jgi:hypothetical protein